MADAVSRGEWPRFHDLCAQLHLRATPVSLPLQCLAILERAPCIPPSPAVCPSGRLPTALQSLSSRNSTSRCAC
eukprot:1529067-Pleurochrysis_carterae.AAC.1